MSRSPREGTPPAVGPHFDTTEADLNAVFRYFVDAYRLPEGQHVESFTAFISPDGKRVMFKLYVVNSGHPR